MPPFGGNVIPNSDGAVGFGGNRSTVGPEFGSHRSPPNPKTRYLRTAKANGEQIEMIGFRVLAAALISAASAFGVGPTRSPQINGSVILIPMMENTTNAEQHLASFRKFIEGCSQTKPRRRGYNPNRPLMKMLLPWYRNYTVCERARFPARSNCNDIPLTVNDTCLRENRIVMLGEGLYGLLAHDDFLDYSTLIIVTDIPCHKYGGYLDLWALFVGDLKDLIDQSVFYRMHIQFLYVGDKMPSGDNLPCEGIQEIYKNRKANTFFHVDYLTFKELENDGVLCDLLSFENGNSTPQPKK